MADLTPTFSGEVQFRRYSDTSTQGTQIVLALADRESLQSFIGLEGKRFMAVLVQIGDDEQPVMGNPISETKPGKSRNDRDPLGDLCRRAVMWCKEPEFWAFLSQSICVDGGGVFDESGAKFAVQVMCGIKSRKELDTNPEAARKFNQLIRVPYQKHLIARGVVR